MSPPLWIALCVAINMGLLYGLCARVPFRKSREIDKQIDCGRIRPWKGDEGKH